MRNKWIPVNLSSIAFVAMSLAFFSTLSGCGNPAISDPGTGISGGATIADSEINIKFNLPAETWVDGVKAAKLMLYEHAERFWNSTPAYTFDLVISTNGSIKSVEGICRSIEAKSYLMDVKLLDSSGASLRRHFDQITVSKLQITPVTLSFVSKVGNVCLYAAGGVAASTKMSLCNPVTKEIITDATYGSYMHAAWSGWNISLFNNIAPGSYTIYWELFDANGIKILEGYKDSVTVTALADTKQSLTVSSTFGSLRVSSASFTD